MTSVVDFLTSSTGFIGETLAPLAKVLDAILTVITGSSAA